MDIVKITLLLLFMTTVTNISFAGQGGGGEQAESECDYIASVDAL